MTPLLEEGDHCKPPLSDASSFPNSKFQDKTIDKTAAPSEFAVRLRVIVITCPVTRQIEEKWRILMECVNQTHFIKTKKDACVMFLDIIPANRTIVSW